MNPTPLIDDVTQVNEIRAERAAEIAKGQKVRNDPLSPIDTRPMGERTPTILASAVEIDVDSLRSPSSFGAARSSLFRIRNAHLEQLSPLEIATAIICKLMPDVVGSAVSAALAQAEDQEPGGLPLAERPAALAEIEEKVFRLERLEEAAILAAAERGIVIGRRHDADPRAVLGEDLTAASARTKLAELEEAGRQLHVVVLDLGGRRTEALDHLRRSQSDLARVQEHLRHPKDVVPQSYPDAVAANQSAFDLLDREYHRAQDAWRSAAACLPALREAMGTRGLEIRAA